MGFFLSRPLEAFPKQDGRVIQKVILVSGFLFFAAWGAARAQAQLILGDSYSVTINIDNNTGSTYGQVSIVDTLPTDFTFTSCSGASCSNNGQEVVWNLGNVPSGTSDTVTVFFTVSSCATTSGSNLSSVDISSPQTVINLSPLPFTVNCTTSTPTATPTFTLTPVPSATPTITLTPTPTFTASPTGTPTSTFTPTITDTPCGFPGNTCTPTPTPYTADIFYVSKNAFSPSNPVSIYVNYTVYPGQYALRIYNSAGEHIKTLDDRPLSGPVSQWYSWDGKNKYGDTCASGVYILYLMEPLGEHTARILLVR